MHETFDLFWVWEQTCAHTHIPSRKKDARKSYYIIHKPSKQVT